MIRRYLLTLFASLFCMLFAQAQLDRLPMNGPPSKTGDLSQMGMGNMQYGDEQHGSNRMTWGRDTTKHDKEIPIGIFQWTIDERLGNVIPAENNDTVVNHYNNFNNTDGYNGAYSYLGNIGSARLSRIFMDRNETEPFLFLRTQSFALTPLSEFRFTNTLSPVTNLAYHSAGDDQNGEDRFRAYFASNINKISGIGFKVDYVYGRGYYNNQQNSFLNGNFFGYYRGEKYEMHAWTQFGHQKNAENGGIEDDLYITNPQSFPQKYGSKDIPTLLAGAFNRNDFQSYHLSHRYYLGYDKEVDVPDSLKPQMPSETELFKALNDSVREVLKTDSLKRLAMLDSLQTDWTNKQVTPTKFVPVGSILHTLRIDNLAHYYYNDTSTKNYFTNNYHKNDDGKDETDGFIIRNTVGLSMQEGFRKWVKMGLTFFASHSYERYKMPTVAADTISGMKTFTENDFSVGGQIEKNEGKFLHYNVNGEFSILGDHIGAFNIDGKGDMNFGISKKDTLQLMAHAFIKNLPPDPFMENYHSQVAWWDNENLSFEERVRVEGTLTNKRSKTSLRVGIENITDHLYFGISNTYIGKEAVPTDKQKDYSHDVRVMQHKGNLQIFSASLKQDFKLGPLVWENEITFQTTSNEDVLPLPKLNVYSNLYLLFRIAKVLRVELGADIRYFTKYYAPDYSPAIGQFAVQDTQNPRIEIGNYPIINAFANLHIKHCRIFVAANHVNAGNGQMFLTPHHPINPMSIRWGVSWNFFN